ncbi:nucleoside monophosphate kinase [Microgenomates group bacterium]|nr:nucleoside monophosphate kinase [Microgenomates group bacterium]
MKIILIGIQGAGKSTQGNMLAEKYGVPYLSSGHIFRQMIKEKTKMGRWLKETVNSGALVPDDVTLEIILSYLKKPEYAKGYILDGFPRTVTQAEAFNGAVDHVVFLDVSDREALWRISGRVSDRDDETLQAIRRRIEMFHNHTQPVIDYYKEIGKLVHVDGEKTIEEVFEQVKKVIKTAGDEQKGTPKKN